MKTAWYARLGALVLASLGCDGSSSVVAGRDGSVDLVTDMGLPPCPTGQTRCGDRCVDVQVDPTHCGACGTTCASGELCAQGRCVATCSPQQRVCGGACIDVRTDRANCGACGAACASGQVCSMGSCQLTCGAGLAMCGVGGDGGAADGGGVLRRHHLGPRKLRALRGDVRDRPELREQRVQARVRRGADRLRWQLRVALE